MKLTRRQIRKFEGNILDAFAGAATGVTGHNVRTVWGPPEGTAGADVERDIIILPWQGPDIPKDKWLKLRGFCMHEEMHLIHTSSSVWAQAIDDGDDVKAATNIMEDARINNLGRQHPQRGQVFDSSLKYTWKCIIEEDLIPAHKKGMVHQMPVKDQLVNAVHAEAQGLYDLGLPNDMYSAKVTRAARSWWAKYKDAVLGGDTKTAYEHALMLADAAEKEQKEQEEQQQEQGDGGGQGNGQGAGQASKEGGASGNGADYGEKQSGGGGSGGKSGGDVSKAWEGAADSSQDSADYQKYLDSDAQAVDDTKNLKILPVGKDAHCKHRAEKFSQAQHEIRSMCNRAGALLRRALIEQARTGLLRNQDEGEIDPDLMTDIANGRPIADPFMRRCRPKRDTDTAVCLMGDASGSMDGTPYAITLDAHGNPNGHLPMEEMSADLQELLACNAVRDAGVIRSPKNKSAVQRYKAAVRIVEDAGGHEYTTFLDTRGIQQAAMLGVHDMLRQARISHEVCAFTGRITTYKTYDQSSVPPAFEQYALGDCDGGGTPLADAMRTMCDRLLRQPQSRKIMICMTDGCASAPDTCQKMIRVLRSLGIEVYGFGIMDTAIRRVFDDWERSTVVAVDPHDFPAKLAELIRHVTLRRG